MQLTVDLLTYEGYDPDELGAKVPPNCPTSMTFEVKDNFDIYDTDAIWRLINKRRKEQNIKEKIIAFSW